MGHLMYVISLKIIVCLIWQHHKGLYCFLLEILIL
uniref:Uncharacterized protein n=1 Tax=Rhizophora mucronata TaxID=61149 RepID=A0A2P2PG65_RHIMU